ncbi:hypothetical protein PTKIN_Ptkin03bG0067500 [Pterospermum kingtungense]
MLMTSKDDPIENLYLINSLCRLGVSYHFEDEIEERLSNLFITLPELMDNNDHDLNTVAVIFQIFRSQGYKMSCDAFNKFKNDDGTFKEELGNDIKGMISLYEASHWGIHGELTLDEALAFTTLHLKSFISQSCPENTLQMPCTGLTTKACQDWKQSSTSPFMKKMNQRMIYYSSLRNMIPTEYRCCFGRNLGSSQVARNVMCKWFAALRLLDYAYDAYGLYEEVRHLTKAIERFDMSGMDEIPMDYLKSIYETVLNISGEVEQELSKEGRSFTVPYCKGEVKKQVLGNHTEARWKHEGIMPTLDEYLENGMWSIETVTALALLMMGMEEADKDAFQWLVNFDAKILRDMSVLGRLYNDSQSNEDEEKRSGQISGTACYMKEYGVSKKEAIEGYQERIRNAWKDLNEGFMVRPTNSVSMQIFKVAFNMGRVSELCYREDDGYTKPHITLKHYITQVLIDPIPLRRYIGHNSYA